MRTCKVGRRIGLEPQAWNNVPELHASSPGCGNYHLPQRTAWGGLKRCWASPGLSHVYETALLMGCVCIRIPESRCQEQAVTEVTRPPSTSSSKHLHLWGHPVTYLGSGSQGSVSVPILLSPVYRGMDWWRKIQSEQNLYKFGQVLNLNLFLHLVKLGKDSIL